MGNTVAMKSHIAFQILAYLIDHRAAQDTADGIAQWWILEQCVKREAPLVSEALDELVKQGFVIEHKAKDSRIHYRINRRRSTEIAALLKQESQDFRKSKR